MTELKQIRPTLDAVIDAEDLYHIEGDRGIRNLCRIIESIGYNSNDVLNTFLADNPGAIEAIVKWIGEQSSPDWNESLRGRLDENTLRILDEDDE